MYRTYKNIEKLTALLASLLLCLPASPLLAQNQFNLNELAEGQLILNLDATEQVNVEQDTLNVFMQYTAQGRNSTAIQNEVNKTIREALDILEDTDNIDYSIQQYNVYTVLEDRSSRNDPDNLTWRAQQGIRMTSMNSAALLVVTARLQETGLTVSNMNYSLSSEKYEEISDSLMEAALMKLQARADEAARILKKSSAELVEINLNGGQNFFGGRSLRAEMSAVDAAMTVPVAEPGETQVNLTVSARALLSP